MQRRSKQAAVIVGAVTCLVIAASLLWLWRTVGHDPGVTLGAFVKIAVVVSLVWAAIGATMGIFIMMVVGRR